MSLPGRWIEFGHGDTWGRMFMSDAATTFAARALLPSDRRMELTEAGTGLALPSVRMVCNGIGKTAGGLAASDFESVRLLIRLST